MPKCCMPECAADGRPRSKMRKKSLFSFPKNDDLLKKWKEILFHTPSAVINKNTKICELHFNESDIVRWDIFYLKGGTIHKIRRERPKLTEKAIPLSSKRHENTLFYAKELINQHNNENEKNASIQVCMDVDNNQSKTIPLQNKLNTIADEHNYHQNANKFQIQDIKNPLEDNIISINQTMSANDENSIEVNNHRNIENSAQKKPVHTEVPNLCDKTVPNNNIRIYKNNKNKVNVEDETHQINSNNNKHQKGYFFDYTFDKLKQDLHNNILIMPQNWAYTFHKNSSVIFTHIHPFYVKVQLICIIQDDMSVQISTPNRKVTKCLDIKFFSSKTFVDYLIHLEKTPCCEGIGIKNIYADGCEGFIEPNKEYDRLRGYQRCSACRQHRKMYIRQQNNFMKSQDNYRQQNRQIKALLRENASLVERVCRNALNDKI